MKCPINDTKTIAIAEKYPIIKKMWGMNSYNKLLKSPFYINLIVSEITDINNISDENQLKVHLATYNLFKRQQD